jgi:hypothetical protein
MDDGDDAPSTSGRPAAAAGKAGQNAELYNALGQHNPKKAKADLKKAKRAKADTAAAAADDDGDDSDFDFDEANDADGLKGSEVGGSRTAVVFNMRSCYCCSCGSSHGCESVVQLCEVAARLVYST